MRKTSSAVSKKPAKNTKSVVMAAGGTAETKRPSTGGAKPSPITETRRPSTGDTKRLSNRETKRLSSGVQTPSVINVSQNGKISTPKKPPVPVKRTKLRKNTIVETETKKYRVMQLLGSGGFGDVYKVIQEGSSLEAALKTEMKEVVDKELQRLHNELQILHDCTQAESSKREHFLSLIDRGKTTSIKFIVMELCSLSLEDIRKKVLAPSGFSPSTAFQSAKQCLQAIWDLHEIGYLHRDIKPGNFAVGLKEKEATIFIIDFGIGRRWKEKDGGVVRAKRTYCKFLGTVRYASRTCHLNKDQSQKDDLESWIYMTMELFDEEAIEWKSVASRDYVRQLKQNFFDGKSPFHIYKVLPEEFRTLIAVYVDKLKYGDVPDYRLLLDQLNQIADEKSIILTDPLDWVGKIRPEHMRRVEKPKNLDKGKDKEKQPEEENPPSAEPMEEPEEEQQEEEDPYKKLARPTKKKDSKTSVMKNVK